MAPRHPRLAPEPAMRPLFGLVLCLSLSLSDPVRGAEPVFLWPGVAPGEKADAGPEKELPAKGDNITRIADVTRPSITLFRPAREKDTGAAVLVCPGGGYNILAWDLEGTEVAEWLNSLGV